MRRRARTARGKMAADRAPQATPDAPDATMPTPGPHPLLERSDLLGALTPPPER